MNVSVTSLKALLVLLLTCLINLPAFAENDDTQLYIYTENYGNYNYSLSGRDYEHRRDDIGGTSTEVVKALLADAGYEYRMRLRNWGVGYGRTLERPYYGIFSTARTAQREDIFQWVGPIAQYNWTIFRYEGSTIEVNDIDDLRSLRVGGYANSATTLFLQDQGIEVSTLPNDSLNAQRLAQDQIDVWIASDVNAYNLAEEAGFPNIEPAWIIRTVDMYLAMNKDTPAEVIDRLQTSLDRVQNQVD
ncbi:substrate-binding periplasmic protein [Saccharospirillum impatiens]|uniref:substrate-binding periplasmic protein n=1 Tax=Saccharospirillum impatiens TaxID=169438 RepID=UPI0003FFF2DF|nr:transporter substrate-binding domain-containing protein [Saccharospirillum impatiens]